MPSISSPFGSSARAGKLPDIEPAAVRQSGAPAAAPSAWLRFRAWLAESGWSRSTGCRQALSDRNVFLLQQAAQLTNTAAETNFKSLFQLRVKAVGGFDREAHPTEARAVRMMNRLLGLARLAGTASYQAEAAAVIRQSNAEVEAARTFRASKFHTLTNGRVDSQLVDRFEDDFCRRCSEHARANPSLPIAVIVENQRQHFLPSDASVGNLVTLNERYPASTATPVLRAYLAEMGDRMWTLNERNSEELPRVSADHQFHRHLLRAALGSAIGEFTERHGKSGITQFVRDAEQHCLSKIELIADERLYDLQLVQFIDRYFHQLLPINWGRDPANAELSEDGDGSTIGSTSETRMSDSDSDAEI